MPHEATCPVLVIDDDAAIAEEACEALEIRNYRALYAENIRRAREILGGHDTLGVVVVDYHMPGMNGLEVIETLSREVERPLAFILLTGDDTQAVAAGALRARAFDFLNKPVDGRLLADAVRRAAEHLAERANRDVNRAGLERETKVLAERLAVISGKLAHRDAILRGLLLSEQAGAGVVSDELRAPLKPLLERLSALKAAIDASGQSPPGLVAALLQDGHKLAEVMDDVLPKGDSGDAEPTRYDVLDLAVTIQRLVPALERLANQRQIRFKTRIPGHLPFLCADETKFARALTNISGALMGALSTGDSLALTTLREGRELVLTYRITSTAFSPSLVASLTHEISSAVTSLDDIKPDTLKLVQSRIVVQLHGGRIRIDHGADSQWSIRLFFPLTEDAPPESPELRLMAR